VAKARIEGWRAADPERFFERVLKLPGKLKSIGLLLLEKMSMVRAFTSATATTKSRSLKFSNRLISVASRN
jgi:hypothetical protein